MCDRVKIIESNTHPTELLYYTALLYRRSDARRAASLKRIIASSIQHYFTLSQTAAPVADRHTKRGETQRGQNLAREYQ